MSKSLECFCCGESTPYDVAVGRHAWSLGDTSVPTCIKHLFPAALLACRIGQEMVEDGIIEASPGRVQVSRLLTDAEIREWNAVIIARSGEVAVPIGGGTEPELTAEANIFLTKLKTKS